jgi:replicative DNA helicase
MNALVRDYDFQPCSIESEQSVIGACIMHPAGIDVSRSLLTPDDFFDEVHRAMFAAMIALSDKGSSITMGFVLAAMGKAKTDILQADMTFGRYVAKMAAEAPPMPSLKHHARIIRQQADLRALMGVAQDAMQVVRTATALTEASQAASDMLVALDAIVRSNQPASVKRVSLGGASQMAVQAAQDAAQGKVTRGTPTGLPTLDHATKGFKPGQLIILAGRPGMGKSTAALQFAVSAAKANHGVAFISLEMSGEELSQRVLSSLTFNSTTGGVPYSLLGDVGITDGQLERVAKAQRAAASLPFEIEQEPGITLGQIGARARQLQVQMEKRGTPLGLLVVDHIGLIRPSGRYTGNRVMEVSEITGGLKVLAKELAVPVLALSQLNRGLENREDKRPQLSDLRDSGSIEQDADVVLSVYREEYYLGRLPDLTPEQQHRLEACRGLLEIEILKQRQGPTRRIPCFADMACNVVAEMAR